MTLIGVSHAQMVPDPPSAPGPVFSPSSPGYPAFLISPQTELTAPSRGEMISTPEPPPVPKKKKRFFAKPNIKVRPVEKVEDLTPRIEVLDTTQEFVSDNLVSLANRLDSFLGEKRADDELNRSSLRLARMQRVRESFRGTDQTEVRFNLRIPRLEQFFKFSTAESKKRDAARRKRDNFRGPPFPDPKVLAAKAREKKRREREPWRFRADTGIVVSIPIPNLFTRARVRKNWIYAKYIPRFEEEVAYYTDRGLIQSTTFNIDREIQKDRQLFRFVNEQQWRINNNRVTTSHGPSIIHNTSPDDVWSYNFRMATFKDDTNLGYSMTNYGLSVAYRRNLKGQWLYGEIVPALDWPQSVGWRRTPGISVKLESLFGRR